MVHVDAPSPEPLARADQNPNMPAGEVASTIMAAQKDVLPAIRPVAAADPLLSEVQKNIMRHTQEMNPANP